MITTTKLYCIVAAFNKNSLSRIICCRIWTLNVTSGFCVHFLKKLFSSFQIAQSYQLLNELKILSSLMVWVVVEVNEFLTEVLFSLPLNICVKI